jgi:mannose-6-phosphate isomerase-like protein (cupin superfamily)
MPRVREFNTRWRAPFIQTWREREKESIIGAARSSRRNYPKFRPFDMLGGPNQALPLLVNNDMRIGVDSVVGTQPRFRRNCDYDLLLFQFAGRTALETEYGPVELGPGELAVIPGGVAHRSSGTADCLRLFAELRDPMVPNYTAEQYASHSEFDMLREGGALWPATNGAAPAPADRVLEELAIWDETPDAFTLLERDYADVTGGATGGHGVLKLRAFDFFTEIVGQKGPGPRLMESATSHVEVYNIEGPQFGFHRALRSEEVGLQFRGIGHNTSEFGEEDIVPGEMYFVPLGIAQSVVGRDEFLRIVIYSKNPWQVPQDLTRHRGESRFTARERVLQAAAYR